MGTTVDVAEIFNVFNVVRIFAVVAISFFLTLALTPLWTRILFKYRLGKQLRSSDQAPVFHELHKNKEGTPTMGGVLVWGTVVLLAIICSFTKFNFISRGQTWLPLAVLILAGVLGAIDDLFGVFRRGPNG